LRENRYDLLTYPKTSSNLEPQLLGKEKFMRIIVGVVTAVLLPIAILVVAMQCAKSFVEEVIR
jgi:hypothetical protein